MASNLVDADTPSGVGWDLVKEELRSKADRIWVEAKVEDLANRINMLEKQGAEAKAIGLSAKRRAMEPHICNRSSTLNSIELRMSGICDDVASWSNWWKKIMVTVIVAVVVAAGAIIGWLYSHKALRDDVEDFQSDVTSLEGSVQRIEQSQEELREAFDKSRVDSARSNAEQVTHMKAALRDVIIELNAGGKRKKR